MCPGRDAHRFSPAQAPHLVVHVACQEVREHAFNGVSHDSVRALARLVTGRGDIITMRPATGPRLVAEMVLKLHRFRDWLTRTDPAVERKMEAIVKRYVTPPGIVLCWA